MTIPIRIEDSDVPCIRMDAQGRVLCDQGHEVVSKAIIEHAVTAERTRCIGIHQEDCSICGNGKRCKQVKAMMTETE